MHNRCLRALSFAVALSCFFLTVKQGFGQGPPPENTETESIRGTVVNGVTHEAIGRALVFSPDNRFATMTDSEGHFEFTFPASSASGAGSEPGQSNRPDTLMARKPGFLDDHNRASNLNAAGKELTISLTPEAMIVGRVALPSSDASDRIQVELYRRQVQDGRAHWVSAGLVTTRSNGEFRFADLSAGSYKLLTHELLDRDPLTFEPRGQLYGYPPVYYPAAPDFATASIVRLSPGETFQANVSPAKREYYPVKLGVTNAPAGLQVGIQIWPQGRAGPGYSLGYNTGDGLIEGSLPDGAYTVQVTTYGPNAMAGMSNITVRGSALSGPAVTLLPNSSIAVSVKEEFQHTETVPQGTLGFGGVRAVPENGRRPNYLQVTLLPDAEFGFAPGASLRPPTGPEDDSLVIENVQPGRYR